MEKMVNIDGKEMRMVANGATPRVYRILFGSDIFADIKKAISDDEVVDMSGLEQLAFTVGRQGGSIPTDMSIDEWLESIDDPMALVNASGDIVSLWTGTQKTNSVSKKKGARQTVK